MIGKLMQMLLLASVAYFVWQKISRWLTSQGAGAQGARTSAQVPRSASDARSPYAVLGVREGAGPEEVRAAYQALVQQYHPDRVATMASEFREVAESKTKEINAAYAAIKKTWG